MGLHLAGLGTEAGLSGQCDSCYIFEFLPRFFRPTPTLMFYTAGLEMLIDPTMAGRFSDQLRVVRFWYSLG